MRTQKLRLLSLSILLTITVMIIVSIQGLPIVITSHPHNLGSQPKSSIGDSKSLNYNNWVELSTYSKISEGVICSWAFTGSNKAVGITVMAMNAANFTSFQWRQHYFFYPLSNGSLYSASGSFHVPYSDTWYIIFLNNDTNKESTTLTYSMGSADVPSAPQKLVATYDSSGYISLSWSPPSSNGGSIITHYNIYCGTNSIGNTTDTNYVAYEIASGQRYSYTVTAVNKVGESYASNGASASVPTTCPTIFNCSAGVNPESCRVYSFTIPSGALNITIKGSFVGLLGNGTGSGLAIPVMIMTPTDYTNWQNGQKVTPIYSSGQVATCDFAISLNKTGTYDLVFFNEFPIYETVQADIVMNYIGLNNGSSNNGIAGYNFITLFIALTLGGLVVLKPLQKKWQ